MDKCESTAAELELSRIRILNPIRTARAACNAAIAQTESSAVCWMSLDVSGRLRTSLDGSRAGFESVAGLNIRIDYVWRTDVKREVLEFRRMTPIGMRTSAAHESPESPSLGTIQPQLRAKLFVLVGRGEALRTVPALSVRIRVK